MSFIQNLFTSRDNNAQGNTYVVNKIASGGIQIPMRSITVTATQPAAYPLVVAEVVMAHLAAQIHKFSLITTTPLVAVQTLLSTEPQ